MCHVMKSLLNTHTIKPVLRGHLCDKEKKKWSRQEVMRQPSWISVPLKNIS